MDVVGPATGSRRGDDAADVVRSEERLAATRSRVASGRVVVGRRLVTEERTVTVTVRREEFYLREVDAEQPGADTPDTAGAPRRNTPRELTFVLREEVPVVTTTVVPYEEVTVAVERIVADVDVTGEVAREVVEVSQDGEPRPVETGEFR